MNKDHFALYALDCDNVAHKDLALRRTVAKIERLYEENARLREALEKISKLENVTVSDFDGAEWEHQRIARAALAEKEEK